ncbi:MOSC domain-containing protein [Rhizobium paknamense]|uniref:MOSC domain-containing protein YiiM n=1 Tax=Rhizobium paknamense TaxID=1206817 RepID=A0ABU0IG87_9HYPH|nr:MOSC domain-containing protein [Rhizobium paknamense]MDQ0457292.1 MOSC domain-containing protein YiiM [Rhizobium paknamense]
MPPEVFPGKLESGFPSGNTLKQRGKVEALAVSASHDFSKQCVEKITLLAGKGVEGDAHCGETVKHRSRVKIDPSQPNLRQVHLIHGELIDALQAQGFPVAPGVMGENITTRNIDLLNLPRGAKLIVGQAVMEVTGLRNPCAQLDTYSKGLTAAVLDRDEQGHLIRKAGIMAIVLQGGDVRVNDEITVELPPLPHQPLERV